MAEKNWAGNQTCSAQKVYYPDSMAQLRDIVQNAPQLRALGSRHSFNTLADTQGELVSLARMNHVLSIDSLNRSVTIEGGTRYGELAVKLEEVGLALHNLASLPHISVAGACATATHGSGMGNGNL